MIMCNGKTVQISGLGIMVKAEFSAIVHAMLEMHVDSGIPYETAKKMLREDFEDGLKSQDELRKESEKMTEDIRRKPAEEVSKRIDELIDLIFGGAADDPD